MKALIATARTLIARFRALPPRAKWAIILAVVLNEARGIMVAVPIAQALGLI